MKIAESQVNLSSQHSLIEQESRQETLRLQKSGVLGQTTGVVIQIRQDRVNISTEAQNLWSAQTQGGNSVSRLGGLWRPAGGHGSVCGSVLCRVARVGQHGDAWPRRCRCVGVIGQHRPVCGGHQGGGCTSRCDGCGARCGQS